MADRMHGSEVSGSEASKMMLRRQTTCLSEADLSREVSWSSDTPSQSSDTTSLEAKSQSLLRRQTTFMGSQELLSELGGDIAKHWQRQPETATGVFKSLRRFLPALRWRSWMASAQTCSRRSRQAPCDRQEGANDVEQARFIPALNCEPCKPQPADELVVDTAPQSIKAPLEARRGGC